MKTNRKLKLQDSLKSASGDEESYSEESAQSVVVDGFDDLKGEDAKSDEEGLLKLKIQLTLGPDHPLARCNQTLKDKGIKSPHFSQLISDGLLQASEEWWQKQTDALIPLDVKVQEALRDPGMRERLSEFLDIIAKSPAPGADLGTMQ